MSENEHIEDINKEYRRRLQKVNQLKNAGQEPYAVTFNRSMTNKEFIQNFFELDDFSSVQVVSLAGRLVSKRGHGKAFFGHIQDMAAKVQIYANVSMLGDQQYAFLQNLDIGDWIGVKGLAFKTKRGELSLKIDSVELLTKSLLPLPEKYHGLRDKELRYRYRYLDLIANEDVKQVFVKRSQIVSCIRQFLQSQDFMEVETPVLQSVYGGAAARPFSTHHNELNQGLYLRIALELYLKRLMVGGFEKVFEIGRVFRNEGISYKHNPEYTLLELYQAFANYEDMMFLTESMFRKVVQDCLGKLQFSYQGQEIDFSKPFERITMKDVIFKYTNINCQNIDELRAFAISKDIENASVCSKGQLIAEVYDRFVESKLIQPTFVFDYPWETSPLARKKPNDPEFVERFECIVCGMELANAFSELTDPTDQFERFQDQLKAKEQGWEDAHEMDEDFVNALKYGMPPTGGLGIGIDRLVMLLCNTPSIRDVLFFPHMRTK